MFKRSIFVKIYLWFWLATALIILTQLSFDRLTDSGPFDRFRHDMHASVLSIYAKMLADLYSRGDHAEIVRISEEFKRANGIDTYLIDDNNREIENRPVSKNSAMLSIKAVRSGLREVLFENEMEFMAVPVKGRDGKQYTLISEAFRKNMGPPPPGNPAQTAMHIILIIMTSGIVCYGFARYITSPVIILREAAKRFAAGELDVRIAKTIGNRKDELSELAEAFDGMAERIETLMTLQKQLIGDISHELRSPLARLNVALELSRRLAGAGAERSLDRIAQEANALNNLIGQLLNLTRFESGVEVIEMRPVSLAGLIKEITADADFEARGRGRRVEFAACDECVVNGNGELLRRAVENVVRNAIKYTADNTAVEISLLRKIEPDGQAAEITVKDKGAGVAEADIEHLFRPFYRVSGARDRQTGGSGLGLAITDRAVMLHHGKVTASNSETGGLIVTLILPLSENG